jgi:hypothetical protein
MGVYTQGTQPDVRPVAERAGSGRGSRNPWQARAVQRAAHAYVLLPYVDGHLPGASKPFDR